MKNFLNVLGVIFSIILTVVLTSLIIAFTITNEVKTLVSSKNVTEVVKKIDVVEIIKEHSDEENWDKVVEVGAKYNLDENQVKELLNNEKIKETIAPYFSRVIDNFTSTKVLELTSDDANKITNVIIEEYNKISATPISEEDKEEVTNLINDGVVANVNEFLKNSNIKEQMQGESNVAYSIAISIVNGGYNIIMINAILIIVVLIALLRFSYYKWIPYAMASTIMASLFLLFINIIINIIKSNVDDTFISALLNSISKNTYISVSILVVITVGLYLLKRVLKNTKVETV